MEGSGLQRNSFCKIQCQLARPLSPGPCCAQTGNLRGFDPAVCAVSEPFGGSNAVRILIRFSYKVGGRRRALPKSTSMRRYSSSGRNEAPPSPLFPFPLFSPCFINAATGFTFPYLSLLAEGQGAVERREQRIAKAEKAALSFHALVVMPEGNEILA